MPKVHNHRTLEFDKSWTKPLTNWTKTVKYVNNPDKT